MFKYTKISEKEQITDKYFAKVLNYFERHLKAKQDLIRVPANQHFYYMFEYGNMAIWLTKNNKISCYNSDEFITIVEIDAKIFAANLPWLFCSVRDYKKTK